MRADTRFRDGVPLKSGWTPKRAKEQLERKTAMMRALSRAVITLSKDGTVASVDIHPDFVYRGNYLTVIGPVYAHRENISEAVRLEIAFGPSVPYEEFRWKEDGKKYVMRRRWYSPLCDEELVKIMPTISETIGRIIDEDLRKRKLVIFRKQIGKNSYREFPRGAFITVPNEPTLLEYLLLARNRQGRDMDFIVSFAKQVIYELKGLKHARYSKKQMEAHKGVRIIVSRMKRRYTEEQIAVVLEYLSKKNRTKYRDLLERILDLLCVPLRKKKEWYEMRLLNLEQRYGKMNTVTTLCPLSIATHPKLDKKRVTLPKHCLRVEVLPSKELQKEAREAWRVSKQTEEVPLPEYHAEF
ncbi:MAG: hypothetical protein QG653_247 [Patescibacteria group bacterium]|nr:hypothetical protein [Patescibacteria group bacterium]